jgi:DNA processing protein
MSKAHWVALATSARVGGKTLTRLLEHFGDLEAVFQARPGELVQIPRIGKQTAAAIAAVDLPSVEADLTRLVEDGVRVITWEELDYPPNLLLSADAPPVLFVRGELSPQDARAVAVVGTRNPTSKNAELASRIAGELASRGWTIVSGLALGIDTVAHQGALAGGGRTLAVLGSGVMAIYPQCNIPLAEKIMGCGAVLSEVHPQTTVGPQSLVARNRIISGLSRAVIVVQSGQNGGSMKTARFAREQGRGLFAVVGGDAGCDYLIEQGALSLNPDHDDWDALSQQLDAIRITAPE